jgi:hypothetical protein
MRGLGDKSESRARPTCSATAAVLQCAGRAREVDQKSGAAFLDLYRPETGNKCDLAIGEHTNREFALWLNARASSNRGLERAHFAEKSIRHFAGQVTDPGFTRR